jgi:hypothetical protein
MSRTIQKPPVDTPVKVAADPGWTGPTRSYDLVKEFVIAIVVIGLVTVGLAVVLGSPDEPGVSLQAWATADPNDFVATTVTELDGTSTSAGYGPPYNSASTGQQLGPLHLAQWGGIRMPVDSAHDFVLTPLSTVTGDPPLRGALARYDSASADQQLKWATAYDNALANAPGSDPARVARGDYGPVPTLAHDLLLLARSGGLDGALTRADGFYSTDYTKPLLFLSDSGYLASLADNQHLSGDQWGMMNETGNFPGQAWLWLYTFWYQIPPFTASSNADAWIWGLMALLSLALVLVPFIPGLRSLPRHLGVHRLIWRDYYRTHASSRPPPGP